MNDLMNDLPLAASSYAMRTNSNTKKTSVKLENENIALLREASDWQSV